MRSVLSTVFLLKSAGILCAVFLSFQLNGQQVFSADKGIERKAQELEREMARFNALDSNQLVMRLSEEALSLAKKHKLNELKAIALTFQSKIYHTIGKSEKAFQLAYQVLKMGDRLGNDRIRIEGHKQLGYLYFDLGQPLKGLEAYKQAVICYNRLGLARDKAYFDLLQNIGALYYIGLPHQSLADLDTAKQYLSEASTYYSHSPRYSSDLADLYVNLGGLAKTRYKYSTDKADLTKAFAYFDKAVSVYTSTGDKKGLGKVLTNKAITYYELKEMEKSLHFFLLAEQFSRQSNDLNTLRIIYDYTRYVFEQRKEYREAYDYREKWVGVSDTLQQLELSKTAEDLQVKHNTEKKEQQISILEKDKKIQTKDLEHQKTIRNSFIVGFLLIGIFGVVFINHFLLIRKQKNIIGEQKAIVEHKNAIVELKNKDITDSINYAKRIQNALLNRDSSQPFQLPHFIFFKPKDIVSGDFYWTLEKQSMVYIAVADCTGHGVPGAFLTMLGTTFLSEINATDELLRPAEILNALRAKFILALSQSGREGGNKDGMDISLLRLNKETFELSWAGANNPLWRVRKEPGLMAEPAGVMQLGEWTLTELKADKQPIGYSDHPRPFTDKQLEIKTGDQLYLFSDGYADQFGGPKGKKLKSAYMKQLLLECASGSIAARHRKLELAFESWMGDFEQVDDVCVIGLTV